MNRIKTIIGWIAISPAFLLYPFYFISECVDYVLTEDD